MEPLWQWVKVCEEAHANILVADSCELLIHKLDGPTVTFVIGEACLLEVAAYRSWPCGERVTMRSPEDLKAFLEVDDAGLR